MLVLGKAVCGAISLFLALFRVGQDTHPTNSIVSANACHQAAFVPG